MGKEESSTEEDSAGKQVLWFYSLFRGAVVNQPGNSKLFSSLLELNIL